MCGIYFSYSDRRFPQSEQEVNLSMQKIKHRGPDASGVSIFPLEDAFVALGHRRLSILDLNERSNQPFHSERYALTYNGEIYNHLDLRKNFLKDFSFKTTSDTETLICMIDKFGLDETLKNLNGMFSFSIYDKLNNEIHLARDRAGEKPLYICCFEGVFAASSDLITFEDISSFQKIICEKALMEYLNFGYVPAPKTIFKNIFKVPPATSISIKLDQLKLKNFDTFRDFCEQDSVSLKEFWTLHEAKTLDVGIKYSDVKQTLNQKLSNAIKLQQLSDVPLGCFLSGGIDSTLIASLMSKANKDTKTFTIGFEFSEYDESIHAEKIAKYLKTDHKTVICSTKETQEIIKSLGKAYTEPFADSSQIPTMMISKIASQDVKVVLTGDCGDELFGGYNRYIIASRYLKIFYLLPYAIRKVLLSILGSGGKQLFELVFSTILKGFFSGNLSQRADKAFEKIKHIDSQYNYYSSMIREWKSDDEILVNNQPDCHYEDIFNEFSTKGFIEKMMYTDFKTYMVDDILCKVDRAAMFHSLETRVPFLDKDVIEYAYSIPEKFKIKGSNSKIILKDLISNYLPRELIERPKQGFGVPISKWMQTDLNKWTKEMLSKDINDTHGFFNQQVVEKFLSEHLEGKKNHEHKLWSLIQFNSWYVERYK